MAEKTTLRQRIGEKLYAGSMVFPGRMVDAHLGDVTDACLEAVMEHVEAIETVIYEAAPGPSEEKYRLIRADDVTKEVE